MSDGEDQILIMIMLFSSVMSSPQRKLITVVIFIAISITAVSCFDLGMRTHWQEGEYLVNDSEDTCGNLIFHSRLLIECIHRIGTDGRFIIAESYHAESKAIRYWLLDMNRDKMTREILDIVEGPFTLNEFERRKVELHINELEFQEVFE